MLLIKNGKILTMASKEYTDGCVLIQGGKIEAVGEYIPEKGCEVFDARGGRVMPGLVDAHSHIGTSEERHGPVGDECNETMNPLTPELRALDAINPMDSAFVSALAAGVTGVMVGPGSSNVVGGQFAFIKTAGRCIDRMCMLAPAAMKIAFGENPKTNYKNQSVMPSTRMTVSAMLRRELFQARAYLNKKRAAQESGEPFDEDFRLESYIPVLEKHIPLKAHVHRADDILTAIRIAKEFDVLMTLDHCTEGHLIAREIFDSGFPAIVGPSLASRTKVEVQYSDPKTAGLLNEAGVMVAITTDHPVTRIEHLALCAGLAARDGLGVEAALRAITINAATICNVAHRIGSIEAGKDADIAVFSANPLSTFTHTDLTIVDGEIAYRSDKK